ncbi:hypothetical protein ING2D1G_0766 [Peptoniphilus sp. ING2-D1G]|nr:hypothetical protein ING2D1G_0766 [Peptoniphilus sp. ING2-D1G]
MEKQVFYDEKGKVQEFDIKAKFSLDDKDYVAMEPVENSDNLIYLLRIETDENDEEYLIGIDDEELQEARDAYEELLNMNEN